ncbi:MAG: hypothetical protein ACO3E9_09040, partial [Gemmataceae bacterium]
MKRMMMAGLLLAGLAGIVASPAFQGLNAQQESKSSGPTINLTSYRDVVKKVLPAVVSIESKAKPTKIRDSRKRNPGKDDPRIPDEMR